MFFPSSMGEGDIAISQAEGDPEKNERVRNQEQVPRTPAKLSLVGT